MRKDTSSGSNLISGLNGFMCWAGGFKGKTAMRTANSKVRRIVLTPQRPTGYSLLEFER